MDTTTTAPSDPSVVRDAIAIAHGTVWGVLTTVDAKCRPRNRIVHPVWTFDGQFVTGWLTTRETPLKARHLAANPHVSIAYIAPNTDFAYFDCTASWVSDAQGRRACWDTFVQAEGRVAYDPATIWPAGPESPDFAVLQFHPYRIQAGLADRIARGEKAGLARLSGAGPAR